MSVDRILSDFIVSLRHAGVRISVSETLDALQAVRLVGYGERDTLRESMMAALAKFKLSPWPYAGPVALVERDEFGMREDFHVVDQWRYLGSAHNDQQIEEILDNRVDSTFDADIYRIVNKFLKAGKIRVLPLKPV